MSEDLEQVAQRLRDLRAGTVMTQQDVANAVGVTRRAVTTWETGNRLPRQPFLSRLAALYGVTAGFIVTGATGDDGPIGAMRAELDVLTRLVIMLTEEVHAVLTVQGARQDEVDALLAQLAAARNGAQAPGGRRRAQRSPR